MGDRYWLWVVAQVMTGEVFHKLIGQNLTNAENLFKAQGVTIVDILGKAVVVTDAPALYEAGTPNKQKVLSLSYSGKTVLIATPMRERPALQDANAFVIPMDCKYVAVQ